MGLTREEVRRVAALARLRLGEEEESLFAAQLSKVVDYIDQLRAVPGAAPDEGVEHEGLEVADEELPSASRETFLANAPLAREGFLVVPQVLGGTDE